MGLCATTCGRAAFLYCGKVIPASDPSSGFLASSLQPPYRMALGERPRGDGVKKSAPVGGGVENAETPARGTPVERIEHADAA
jgi:hypothetical protein